MFRQNYIFALSVGDAEFFAMIESHGNFANRAPVVQPVSFGVKGINCLLALAEHGERPASI